MNKAILRNNIQEKVHNIGRFTIVELVGTLEESKRKVDGVGISRRSQADRQNKDYGYTIARGRAMKALVMKLNGKTVHNNFMG